MLLVRLGDRERLEVGRLGVFDLAPGCYAYVGSAFGGLDARIARHLRTEKRLHWHIDYLLARAAVTGVLQFEGLERNECALSERLRRESWTSQPIRGFGSSDCRCASHLHYLGTDPDAVERARAALRVAVSMR